MSIDFIHDNYLVRVESASSTKRRGPTPDKSNQSDTTIKNTKRIVTGNGTTRFEIPPEKKLDQIEKTKRNSTMKRKPISSIFQRAIESTKPQPHMIAASIDSYKQPSKRPLYCDERDKCSKTLRKKELDIGDELSKINNNAKKVRVELSENEDDDYLLVVNVSENMRTFATTNSGGKNYRRPPKIGLNAVQEYIASNKLLIPNTKSNNKTIECPSNKVIFTLYFTFYIFYSYQTNQ